MGERIVGATLRLRRYAHALLAAWPRADHDAPRADQDADDLAQQALLDVWRAGRHGAESDLDVVLFRRATILARRRFSVKAAEILGGGSGPAKDALNESEGHSASSQFASGHFAWAPEARALPRLPLDLRAILALVMLERMSYADAARALDMPEQRALARLAVARARLAHEISGAGRPHLIALPPNPDQPVAAESDLHRFADDLLDEDGSAEIADFLETSPDAARRVAEWRRQGERLRSAFAPLMTLPLPPFLDFAAPEAFSRRRGRTTPAGGVFRRLGALFEAPMRREWPRAF
jgi:DNA-directed RNA polymerase specialized sigma24 family protein